MKENHTIKNPLKKRSLQWRLTLLITLLVTVTCILMYFFISNSAVTGMEATSYRLIKLTPHQSLSM